MKRLILTALAMIALMPLTVKAIGWPSHYEGVMLQGFYWDSYSDTKWTKLESQADELSKYFDLIWIPNSGYAGGHNNMGYMPIYWFTNHRSSFGTEAELRSMINTYKAKGTGFIADVVINHRNGVSNWTNFPAEKWNGQTWQIGPEGICNTDEVKNESGQARPTGNADTGEDFNGARDLDHTNANVQNNCKNYVKCLLTDFGYVGARYDMVKGYGGQYNKIYNEYNNIQFSVGEYFDANYDLVAGWIEATGKTSAAFDFPMKYQLNKAFNGWHNYSELVWKANGVTDQPAGMIHFGYPRYSVTFVDNHDTYRDGSKYTGDVCLANCFMLCSPGTPCVFLPHYKQYKSQIQALIIARKTVGVHNESAVNVLETNSNCYVAEVTGSKGKLWVKMGNSSRTAPSGYYKAASGSNYEVYTSIKPGDTPQGGGAPSSLYVIGEVNGNTWDPAKGVRLTKNGDTFSGSITIDDDIPADGLGKYFSFAVNLDASGNWDNLNVAGNRYAPAFDTELSLTKSGSFGPADSEAKAFYVATPGTYILNVDFKTNKASLSNPTGVADMIVEDAAPAVYYNLQGQRVDNPTNGIYIRVQSGKSEKVRF